MAITTLRQIFSDIANALRRKGIEKATIHPEEYASLIDGITVGDGLTDTNDADAEAIDIASGKTAYVKGLKVTGSVPEVTSIMTDQQGTISLSSPGVADTRVTVTNQLAFDRIFRQGAKVQANIAGSEFGTATTADVLSGKTFTGASGLKKTGTLVPQTGTDTSDATATAGDIASGKTAYIKGSKVFGTLRDFSSGTDELDSYMIGEYNFGLGLVARVQQDTIYRAGTSIRIVDDGDYLGDAEAKDVAAGKTFTSEYGLRMTGTAPLTVSKFATIYSGINNIVFDDHSITLNSAFFNTDVSSITKFVGIQGSTWSQYPSNMSGKNILLGFYINHDGQIARGLYTTGNSDINVTELGFTKTSSSIKISCNDNIYFYNSYQTLFG